MKTFLNALLVILIMVPATLMAQTTVTGTVTDKANAMPLPGVNVIVKGTSRGTSTDFDGNFSLEVSQGETPCHFLFRLHRPRNSIQWTGNYRCSFSRGRRSIG
jgi:hypothetical protein